MKPPSIIALALSLLAAAAGCSAGVDASNDATNSDEQDVTASAMPHVLCEDLHPNDVVRNAHNMFSVEKGQVIWKWQNGVFTSPPNQLTFPVQAKKNGSRITLTNKDQNFTFVLDTKDVVEKATFTPCPDDEDDCENVPGHGFGITSSEQDGATLNTSDLVDFKMQCMRL
jgi:hypothetical protein